MRTHAGLQTDSGAVHHCNQYFLFLAGREGNLDSSIPDILQLRSFERHLHKLYNIQVRIQGMGQINSQRRMEMCVTFIAIPSILTLTFIPPDFILAFMDVQGNYFTVLAYRYTTILSAQLINFWAIVVVVLISFLLLKVRYHFTQVAGILICVGGMGILLASDHITGANGGDVSSGNQLKGDLFALLGATFYGLTNVAEEFLVSKRPLYEVVGQLGFWAMLINGTQAGIFDRASFRSATWDGQVAGYIVGYTLCLFLFYTLAPLMFRLASAAFFNISLLTGNFWGVVIGIKVFGLTIYFLYPIAFVLIMIGLVVYFVGKQVLGEAKKPWLGKNQERGVSGVGTARRKVERPDAIV